MEEEAAKRRVEEAKKKQAQEAADLELAKRDPWWAQHLADKKAKLERSRIPEDEEEEKASSSHFLLPMFFSCPACTWRSCLFSVLFDTHGWHRAALGWLCWLRCASAVFLLVFGIMAGIFQKDSCCGMYKADYAGCDALRAVSFPGSQGHDARHHASMDQNDSCCGMYKAGLCWLRCTSRCFLFPGSQAHDARHHAGMDRKDSCCGMYKAGYAGQTVVIPQLQFLAGRRFPFRAALTALHGPALLEDHRDFAVAVHGD